MELHSPVSASDDHSGSRPTTDAELAWHEVLSELEAQLEHGVVPAAADGVEVNVSGEAAEPDAAARTLAGSGMWRSPAQMPPLPDSMRARAEALHLAQAQRERELRAEQIQVQRQLEALSVVPRTRSASASVYLDVVG